MWQAYQYVRLAIHSIFPQAVPTGPVDVQRGGSVPGHVTQSAGGVARNVAESLAMLLRSSGAAALPLLVSAVGDDLTGRALLQHCRSLGCAAIFSAAAAAHPQANPVQLSCSLRRLSTENILQLPGRSTPTVAVVFDMGGEVAACVADVALLEAALTPAALLKSPAIATSMASAPLLMLDANLSSAAIAAACQLCRSSGSSDSRMCIWFEPVSVPKSTRATAVLSQLDFTSPNAAELRTMAAAARQQQERSAHRSSDRKPCESPCACATGGSAERELHALLPDIRTLLAAGVRHIVLTLGAEGAALCRLAPDCRSLLITHVPALMAAVVNCSGAGDCLVAGCLFGLALGAEPEAALACGVAAAKAAVQSPKNVPLALDAADLKRDAAMVAAQARRLSFTM